MILSASSLEYAFRAVCAKANLHAAGWSYRTAATELGVSYQHVCYVLNGQRESRSLLGKLTHLPARKPTQTRTNPQNS